MRRAVFVLTSVLVLVLGSHVLAADSSLPDGFVIADDGGVRVSSDGGYLIQKSGILPGDIVNQTITIRNLREDDEVYELGLLADPAEVTGIINLREHCAMTLTLDGAVIYTGPVDGFEDGLLREETLALGQFGTADEAILQVRIVIDEEWALSHTVNTVLFNWHFTARQVELEPDPTDPAPSPNTGQMIQYVFYALVGLLVVAVIVLYAAYRKRQKTLA